MTVNLVPGVFFVEHDEQMFTPRYADANGNPVPEPFPPAFNDYNGSWSHYAVGRYQQVRQERLEAEIASRRKKKARIA